jgi:undecaprenyl-diphosphatase
MSIDAQIVTALQHVSVTSRAGEWAAIFLARVLILAFAPLLAWVWAYGTNKEKHAVKEALWSLGLALLLGEILSLMILRVRPFLAVDTIITLIPPPLTSSFPSMHTASAAAMSAALYWADRRLGWIAVVLVLGVAVGRMAVGVHYPTDIMGGMLLGVAAFALVRVGHKALRKKLG